MGIYARRDLYESISSSLATSGMTSEVYNVEVFETLTLQMVGSIGTILVQGSNDNGRTSAIANWSTLTTDRGPGIIYLEPGFAWIRSIRSDSSNPSSVMLGGWTKTF